MRSQVSLAALLFTAGACVTAPAWADSFFFTTGNADGKLGALSRSDSIETETADDFILDQTTVISGATMTGLVLGRPFATKIRATAASSSVFAPSP